MASKEEVIEFISKSLSIPVRSIRDNSSVNSDLRVDGDDAVEFIESFAKRFDVDISKFKFEQYFGAEISTNPLQLLARLFRKSQSNFKRLEVRDLVEATRSKYLR